MSPGPGLQKGHTGLGPSWTLEGVLILSQIPEAVGATAATCGTHLGRRSPAAGVVRAREAEAALPLASVSSGFHGGSPSCLASSGNKKSFPPLIHLITSEDKGRASVLDAGLGGRARACRPQERPATLQLGQGSRAACGAHVSPHLVLRELCARQDPLLPDGQDGGFLPTRSWHLCLPAYHPEGLCCLTLRRAQTPFLGAEAKESPFSIFTLSPRRLALPLSSTRGVGHAAGFQRGGWLA